MVSVACIGCKIAGIVAASLAVTIGYVVLDNPREFGDAGAYVAVFGGAVLINLSAIMLSNYSIESVNVSLKSFVVYLYLILPVIIPFVAWITFSFVNFVFLLFLGASLYIASASLVGDRLSQSRGGLVINRAFALLFLAGVISMSFQAVVAFLLIALSL